MPTEHPIKDAHHLPFESQDPRNMLFYPSPLERGNSTNQPMSYNLGGAIFGDGSRQLIITLGPLHADITLRPSFNPLNNSMTQVLLKNSILQMKKWRHKTTKWCVQNSIAGKWHLTMLNKFSQNKTTETNLKLPGQTITNSIPQPEHFTAFRQNART